VGKASSYTVALSSIIDNSGLSYRLFSNYSHHYSNWYCSVREL